jgi:hypothetical protein
MKQGFWAIAAMAAAIGSAASAADDGFAAFYRSFAAAAAKDDQAALAGMVVLGPGLDSNDVPLTFAKFHRAALGLSARRCLAKGKAVRDVDGTGAVGYSVFCGKLIYVFSMAGGGWRLTDISPDD